MPFNLKKIFEPEIAAWIGFLALIFAFASIGISIAISPWFSWTKNALSDLGVSEAAPIFNSGLIVTGILLSIFAISFVREERENSFGLFGAIGLLFMGISVVGVGIFTEAFLAMHILFAFSCFGSLISSSILLGIRYILKRETRALGALTLSIGILSIVPWFALRMTGLAIQEAVSAFPAIAWFIALSIRLHKRTAYKLLE